MCFCSFVLSFAQEFGALCSAFLAQCCRLAFTSRMPTVI
jgi:hypothetical protein